jgi:hypothetical protein
MILQRSLGNVVTVVEFIFIIELSTIGSITPERGPGSAAKPRIIDAGRCVTIRPHGVYVWATLLRSSSSTEIFEVINVVHVVVPAIGTKVPRWAPIVGRVVIWASRHLWRCVGR